MRKYRSENKSLDKISDMYNMVYINVLIAVGM